MPFNTDRYWGDIIKEMLNESGKKFTPQEYSEAQNREYWIKRSEELDKVTKKLEKQVMKEMSEPTMGALEAVFGISQDRYLNSL